MTLRYLFGPVTKSFGDQNLHGPIERGECLIFEESGDFPIRWGDTWETIASRFPSGWKPDFLVLYLPYRVVPAELWEAPLPIIGLAGDWNLQWHLYRHLLRRCDMVFSDAMGVDRLARAGFAQTRAGCLFGWERHEVIDPTRPSPRPIDVLFVGNSHAAIHKERAPWLARLGQLARRWNIQIVSGVFGEEYRRLLAQSRIVFNRGIRREWNMRVGEAIGAGALLFQEADNLEVPLLLRDRKECVFYNADNLESLLEYYLQNENECWAIAQAAQARLEELTFEHFWEQMVGVVENEWKSLTEQTRCRSGENRFPSLLERTWQHLSASIGNDSMLTNDLGDSLKESPSNAALHNFQGIELQANNPTNWGPAANAFQRAWTCDPRHLMAGLNLAEVLSLIGQKNHAIEQARRTLAVLDRMESLPEYVVEAPHAPRIRLVSGGNGRPAWMNAGNPKEEANAKRKLLQWQLHRLLGDLTGDVVHFFQSYAARPDLAVSQGVLGCALGRANRPAEAMPYLKSAYRQNPFDRNIARAYFHALGQLGITADQHVLISERQHLARAAPRAVPTEDWFTLNSPALLSSKETKTLRIVWQGAQNAIQSLALVNREICNRLINRGHELSMLPPCYRDVSSPNLPGTIEKEAEKNLMRPAEFHISHQWPPDFNKPSQGRWIVMQHWEYGSLPRAWVEPFVTQVDEVWVASAFVRDCFVQSGILAEKVKVIPLGVGPEYFQDQPLYPLKTQKKYRFLFVGGTLERKGIDLLLKAYHQVYSIQDDVCLVVKDMGSETFYKGQTAADRIKQYQQQPYAPEVEYLDQELSTQEMAGLYGACQCLVHPYRGEGFGLPIAEAMACGLPVIVTGLGASLDFCREEHAYLLPAKMVRFPKKQLDNWETVDFPFWAEPDLDSLRWLLRHVPENPQEARIKGAKARTFIRDHFTWEHTIAAVEARLGKLASKQDSPPTVVPANAKLNQERPLVSLTMIVKNEEQNLPACLESVADLVDEVIIVDTGSTDATVELARRQGAKVFHFPWIDDFAAARNEALRHATGDWIFWMDADDRLDETNRRKMQKILANLPTEMVGFVMKCLCLTDHHSTPTMVDHVRLFTNHPDLRWKYRIHEQILLGIRRLGGKVCWSDVVIQHLGYQNEAVRKKKLERDFRILNLEHQENPDDPFTLFNLGNAFLEKKMPEKALQILQRSLQRSRPTDSIVRKLYSMVAQCNRILGNMEEAKRTCHEGRTFFPQDPELLFQESLVLQNLNDKHGAIACLLQMVEKKDETYFASVDTGLRGCKGYHNLGVLYHEIRQWQEAEKFWRLASEKEPGYLPSLVGLGDLFLKQERLDEFQGILSSVANHPHGQKEFKLLLARKFLADNQFANAREAVNEALGIDSEFLPAWVILSHILLKEGKSFQEAETAINEILKRDPQNKEARQNLTVLIGLKKKHFHKGSERLGPTNDRDEPTNMRVVTSHSVTHESIPRCRVSLAMIVKNEEKNLLLCLDNVSDLVDEIVIVDTGSTDRTVDLAKSRGAKVLHFPWIDDFAAARNEALRHTAGRWIFWMDADDRLDKDNRQKLRALFATLPLEFACFIMKYLCLPDSETGTAIIVDRPRLFRKHPDLRWKYRVHEQVFLGPRSLGRDLRMTDIVIHHVGLQDADLRRRKLARNLRLLQMEYQENSDDPFILFYLGSTFLEQKSPGKALEFLRRGLRQADPNDLLCRKLYSTLALCYRSLENLEEARKICQEGRKTFAQDPEILFQESLVLQKLGDKQGAIACLLQLVETKDETYFASVDTGLRGAKGYHNLGVLYLESNQWLEAERHWPCALEKEPGYLPSLVALGDLLLKQERFKELQEVIRNLTNHPHGEKELNLLQARKLLAEKQFTSAHEKVHRIICNDPTFLPAWVLQSHILLQEGKDWKAAEKALREILARDPNNENARKNLTILAKEMGKNQPESNQEREK